MSDRTVIRAEGLGKRYHIRRRVKGARRRLWRRTRPDTHWALRDLDLEVPQGEILGLIGPNGAGKSTLLQLLARTTAPSEGRFSIAGRVASMLEVGVGFSWALTGRENIYLSGTLLGMRRHEVRSRMGDIVAFAGIGEYLDMPVKHYSSGMFVRLGFAVAAHLEADVMLVDEVLSVGDASFRTQCLDKMRAAADEGRTIIYVSHGLGTVREFCDRAILLEGGALRADGPPTEVIAKYLHVKQERRYVAHESTGTGTGTGVRTVRVESEQGGTGPVDGAAVIRIVVGYELDGLALGCSLIASIVGPEGPPLLTSCSDYGGHVIPAQAGRHEVTMELPAGLLVAGDYHVALAFLDGGDEVVWSSDTTAAFAVTGTAHEIPGFPAGSARLRLPCRWS